MTPSPVESDEMLVTKAVAGDRFALQRLLVRHHDRLVATLHARIPDDLRHLLLAEDLCQEAYIAAIRDLPGFVPAGDGSFYGWLRVIAERRLVDGIRLHHALKRGGGLAGTGQAADSSESTVALLEILAVHERTPSQSAARREAVQAVQDALDGLKGEYRQAIRLRHIEGLSLAQAARRLGRTKGAVRMLCSRGLRELAEAIGDPARLLSSSA